ncbi:hypothetical protein [Kordia sp.]|uniref:hypothetical protein n=1 Tax=Kordia sp. TaxID=1965332 RepID=UPI003D2669E9
MKNKKKPLGKLLLQKNVISSLNNIKGGEVATNCSTGAIVYPPETFPYVGNCIDPFSENGQCISLDGLADCNSMNADYACAKDTGAIKVNPPNNIDIYPG